MKNGILAVVGLVLWSSAVMAQDMPKSPGPLPHEIVEAWESAGAEAGFLSDGPVTFLFRHEAPVGPSPPLPAFRFGDAWRVGLLAKLPAPATPFGLSFANMTDAGLKDLARMTSLQMLDVRTTNVTDAGLKALASLRNLQALKLGPRVTDKGLKELPGLPSLNALYLLGGGITDAGLKELGAVKNLQRLSLRGTLVTDQGLKELSALKGLQMLDLYYTKVTDVGLKELALRKGLQTLELTKTEVTDTGVLELRKALPGCKISFRKKKG